MRYLCLLFVLALSAKAPAQDAKMLMKRIQQSYKPVIRDSLYFSECEVSNADYELWLRTVDTDMRRQLRPDSSGWRLEPFVGSTMMNEPIVKVYNWHPAYQQFPVVNITQEMARVYCMWLTEQYNQTPGRTFKRVLFRLPTAPEWELAARGISKERRIYPWDGFFIIDSKGRYRANFAPLPENFIKRNDKKELVLSSLNFVGVTGGDGYVYPCACHSKYPPNEYGLYHMAGNVSEYIDETGHTKGGSFISPGYYLQIEINEPEFEKLELGGAFIGFRPVMVVLEK